MILSKIVSYIKITKNIYYKNKKLFRYIYIYIIKNKRYINNIFFKYGLNYVLYIKQILL